MCTLECVFQSFSTKVQPICVGLRGSTLTPLHCSSADPGLPVIFPVIEPRVLIIVIKRVSLDPIEIQCDSLDGMLNPLKTKLV